MSDRTLTTIAAEREGRLWCLFLDRDGVINTRITDGYVRSWEEFEFIPGVLDALRTLAEWAPRIVVVTNQQGVGKGLMSTADLTDIHDRVRHAVADSGGRIDGIQSCPHLADAGCSCRKPGTGMAEAYLDAHPEVDGALSVMVGDTDSDMAMGRRLAAVTGGCATIRIDDDADPRADLSYPNLAVLAAAVRAVRTRAAGHSAE